MDGVPAALATFIARITAHAALGKASWTLRHADGAVCATQPIEHLASFRAMPNLLMLRPGDGNETAGAYKVDGQACLCQVC